MNVELIAITQPLQPAEFTGETTNRIEEFIEHCGRVSHRSEPKGNPANFIAARINEGHESILEHASATFEISNVSRVCSHQLVRYRLASYTQESQRHTDPTTGKIALPEPIAADEQADVAFRYAAEVCAVAYRQMVENGIKPEDARYILPQAFTTRLVVTMNFRELRHFFTQRITVAAQREIRRLAICMLILVNLYAPAVFGDIYRTHKTFFMSDFEFAEETLGLSD